MEYSARQNVLLAISYLIRTDKKWRIYTSEESERWKQEVVFPEHPFGLEYDFPGSERLTRQCRVIADPGHTDGSVGAMMLALQYEVRDYHPVQGPQEFRLRIIKAQIAQDWRDPSKYVHWLYFEFINRIGSFICGGCTDCSGSGGRGAEQVELVFSLFSELCGIPIETVVIPMAQAEPAIDKLNGFYDDSVRKLKQELAVA